MNLHRSMSIIAVLSIVAVAPGCKKDEKSKPNEMGSKAADSKSEPPKDDSSKGQGKTDKPVELPTLGKVTVEQAIATMGKSAPHRLVMRAPKLVKAGFVEMAMSAMPDAQRAKYDSFVKASGFDPVTRTSGALIYAEGDLREFETARATMIFGVTGSISEEFVGELDKLGDDDDADDDDDEVTVMKAVFLAELPAEVRTKLLATFSKVDADEPPLETETVGGGVVLASRERGSMKYGYLWSGGLIIAEGPSSPKPLLADAKKALEPLLLELAKASAATPEASDLVIDGRGSAKGTTAQFSVRITDKVIVDTKATPSASEIPELTKIIGALPIAKAQPEKALASIPPEARPLTRLAIDGLTAKFEDKVLDLHFEADLNAFKAALKPLIDKAKK